MAKGIFRTADSPYDPIFTGRFTVSSHEALLKSERPGYRSQHEVFEVEKQRVAEGCEKEQNVAVTPGKGPGTQGRGAKL